MFSIFQLLILAISSLIICALIPNRIIRFVIAYLLGLFLILQISSLQLGGSLIDYKFYENSNPADVWSLRMFFAKELIVGTIGFVLIGYLYYWISSKLRIWRPNIKVYSASLIVSVILLALPGGIFDNLYEIVSLKNSDEKSFQTALSDLGMDSETYVELDQITASAGKNIIVLSLESLEKNYLKPPLDHLTPNLQSLAQANTFYTMKQNEGSMWTSASMYTTMTGLPAFFRSDKNEIFQNSSEIKIPNLGGILKKANYDLTYLIAKKEFSGVEDMLNRFEFTVKSEKDLDVPQAKGFWGMHDKDLFEAAQKELLVKKEQGRPFALFLSNIAGHFPNGVYDKRMEAVLPPQDSDIEFMASAVDLFVKQLFDFLEAEDMTESTVVYILPDHLLMQGSSNIMQKLGTDRDLYLLTTANAEDIGIENGQTISQLDLPRAILNGAGVKTNATFLADYLEGQDKEAFIKDNKTSFVALNEAALKTFDYKDGITIRLSPQGDLDIIANNETDKYSLKDIKQKTLYRLLFNRNMKYMGYDQPDNLNKAFFKSKTARVVFSISGDVIHAYLRKGKHIGVAKQGVSELTFSKEDIQIFDDWLAVQSPEPKDPKKIELRSIGYHAIKTRGRSRIYTGLKSHQEKRGMNVLYVDEGGYTVANFDTYNSKDAASQFVALLEELTAKGDFFAIVASDAAAKQLGVHQERLRALGFKQMASLQGKQAYVGMLKEGIIREYTDDLMVVKEETYHPIESTSHKEKLKDRSRFIAHAGGKIEGYKSTNSIEALNQSYAKGFRYFELDIITTSDGKMVASHDWDTWAKQTDYSGTLPPTQAVFLSKRPYGQFTPMGMDRINAWFEAHPDAILVSDKINTPKALADAFDYPDRLMMELFSWEAFKEAENLGLKGRILSHNVLKKIKGSKVEKLQQMGVRYLAVSRKDVPLNVQRYNDFLKAGIKTYVYNVGFEKGKNEEYVSKFEMNVVYGMYADDWTFPQP